MSSLQEQLLKAGLVDQKKLTRSNQEKSKQVNLARKKRAKNKPRADAPGQQLQNKKIQRDRELNQKRQEEVRRRELAAQAIHLIDINKLDRTQGEHPYGFVYKRKVKQIYVTETQKNQLVEGQLVIATCVKSDGRKFELVPAAVAKKIVERDESCVIDIGQQAESDSNQNDPYSEYRVPDDLTW